MAVDPHHRRQGYGLLLLEAVEEIARLGGQRDLYLHLRYATSAWQAVPHTYMLHIRTTKVLLLLCLPSISVDVTMRGNRKKCPGLDD